MIQFDLRSESRVEWINRVNSGKFKINDVALKLLFKKKHSSSNMIIYRKKLIF
jgi:hypothetical protein